MNAPRNLLEYLITLKPLCAHAYEHGVHQHNAPAHTHTKPQLTTAEKNKKQEETLDCYFTG